MMKKILNKIFRTSDPYPDTVAEVLDDTISYKPATNAVMEELKAQRIFRLNPEEFADRLRWLNAKLSAVYKVEEPILVFVNKCRIGSCYIPAANVIILERERNGGYSLTTYLHEFGHVLGKNEVETCRWSINLFRKHFPKSFAKLDQVGHLLYRREDEKKN